MPRPKPRENKKWTPAWFLAEHKLPKKEALDLLSCLNLDQNKDLVLCKEVLSQVIRILGDYKSLLKATSKKLTDAGLAAEIDPIQRKIAQVAEAMSALSYPAKLAIRNAMVNAKAQTMSPITAGDIREASYLKDLLETEPSILRDLSQAMTIATQNLGKGDSRELKRNIDLRLTIYRLYAVFDNYYRPIPEKPSSDGARSDFVKTVLKSAQIPIPKNLKAQYPHQ